MYRKTITAAAIIAAGLTAAPAPAQADELVGFDWQLPSGQWLSDEHGVTAGAPELPAGLYRMCFTIPDYATSARYTVTTGANPPRIGDGDWSWTWDDISARIADGTFTKARDFSYSFNAAETTNRDGDPVPGVLNECDIFRGVKPVAIEPGQEHTGGVFTPTPTPEPSTTPTPTESETPTWTPSAEPSETPSETPTPSAQPSSSTSSASTSEPASPSSSPAPQEASSSPTPEVTPSETPSPAPTASDVPSPSPTAGAPTESTEPQEGPSTPVADPLTSSTPPAAPSETPSSAQSATQKPPQPASSTSPAATTSADRPTHRPALAATGADAAIAWGVVIGFGAILTGVYLTTRKPKH